MTSTSANQRRKRSASKGAARSPKISFTTHCKTTQRPGMSVCNKASASTLARKISGLASQITQRADESDPGMEIFFEFLNSVLHLGARGSQVRQEIPRR